MALYGPEWQSPLARALGVNARSIRFWASGSRPIPEEIAAKIRNLMGVADPLDLDQRHPFDDWILGDGASDREYLIHTRRPRFIARIAADDMESDDAADRSSGVTFHGGGDSGYTLCEIVWIDAPPGAGEMVRLMESACDAVDASVE
jgi:hypothetical protein